MGSRADTTLEAYIPEDCHLQGLIAVVQTSEVGRWSDTWESLDATQKPPGVARVKLTTYDVCDGRNVALQAAREMGVEWCWLVDDDQVWEPDLLLNLLARDVPIVQPLTLMRVAPFLPVGFANRDAEGYFEPIVLTNQTGLIPVTVVGGGCLLVRKVVWETLPAPWFRVGQTHPGKMGEDTSFCLRAAEAGFPVYADSDHCSGHLRGCQLWPYRRPDGVWMTRIKLGQQVFDVPAAAQHGPREYTLGKRRATDKVGG